VSVTRMTAFVRHESQSRMPNRDYRVWHTAVESTGKGLIEEVAKDARATADSWE